VGKLAATVITSSLGFNAFSPNKSEVRELTARRFAEEPEFVVMRKFRLRYCESFS
jgi:hypothetical protein